MPLLDVRHVAVALGAGEGFRTPAPTARGAGVVTGRRVVLAPAWVRGRCRGSAEGAGRAGAERSGPHAALPGGRDVGGNGLCAACPMGGARGVAG